MANTGQSGDYIIYLGLNVQKFGAQVSKARSYLNSQLAGVMPAVGLTALTMFSERVARWGGEIAKMSNRANVSKKAIQEWEYAAKQTDITVQDVTESFRYMRLAQEEAIMGGANSKKADWFKQFGVTLQEVKSLNPEELFDRISKFMSDNPNVSQRAVQEVFGRGGDRYMGAIRDGFVGATEEFRRMGLAASDEVINNLDQVGDAMEKLKQVFIAGWAPVLSWLFKTMTGGFILVSEFAKGIGRGIQGLGAASAATSEMNRQGLPEKQRRLEEQLVDAKARGLDYATAQIERDIAAVKKQSDDIWKSFTGEAPTGENWMDEAIKKFNEMNQPPSAQQPSAGARQDGLPSRESQGGSGDLFSVDKLTRIGLFTGTYGPVQVQKEISRNVERLREDFKSYSEFMRSEW